jgi:PTH1 family peptidyl-tRNA hydrolase
MTLGSLAGRQDRAPEALVVCDDVNLDFGKLRLRASGSAGGHHGLESVIEVLGTEDFPRLRIGVKNENMPKDLAGFVLERFSGPEKKELPKILENAASVCEAWINEGFDAAVNRLSRLQSIRGEKE